MHTYVHTYIWYLRLLIPTFWIIILTGTFFCVFQLVRALCLWSVYALLTTLPQPSSAFRLAHVSSVHHQTNRTARHKREPLSENTLRSQFAGSMFASANIRWLSATPSVDVNQSRRHVHNVSLEHHPWHCEMTTKWKQLRGDVYPSHVATGRCRQRRCFHDLYECTPIKYVMHVLRRKRHKYRPVPRSATADSVYEQVWSWTKVRVTVGCECSRRKASDKQQLKVLFGLV